MVTMVLGATERLMHERLDAEKHRGLVDRFLSELKEREKA
jgi:F0F1-type ATP synthase membrane subunit b/b'